MTQTAKDRPVASPYHLLLALPEGLTGKIIAGEPYIQPATPIRATRIGRTGPEH